MSNWKIVSGFALFGSTAVSLSVGVFVYMTFWEETLSDIFQIYPQTWMIDVAKLLLCITMILTFPLPFFTCRELLIVMIVHPFCGISASSPSSNGGDNNNSNNNVGTERSSSSITVEETLRTEIDGNDLEQPLLSNEDNDDIENDENEANSNNNDNTAAELSMFETSSVSTDISRVLLETVQPKNWLLPDDNRQLQWPGQTE